MNEQGNQDELWKAAIEDTPDVYFNEFGVVMTESDILIVLRKNRRNKIVLNASYMTAKALALTLLQVIKNFEEATDHQVPYLGNIEGVSEKND